MSLSGPGIPPNHVEGLKLSERDRSALIRKIAELNPGERRKQPRIVVEGGWAVFLAMEYPGGSSAYFRVYPWDLSKGGMGFFHRAFIYPGTRCTITAKTSDGQPVLLKGEVIRCSHVSGTVHTVGVKFEMEIDPADFLGEAAVSGLNPPAPPVTIGDKPDGDKPDEWWDKLQHGVAELSKLVADKGAVESLAKQAAQVVELVNTKPASAISTPGAHAAPKPPEHAQPSGHASEPAH